MPKNGLARKEKKRQALFWLFAKYLLILNHTFPLLYILLREMQGFLSYDRSSSLWTEAPLHSATQCRALFAMDIDRTRSDASIALGGCCVY